MRRASQTPTFNTYLTDVGLEHLAGLTNLRVFNLANTAISDQGLVPLKGMTKLNGLNLDGTKITGSVLSVLKEMALEVYWLRMHGPLLTGKNWMEHVPNFKSFNNGLMMVTRDSKITPEEEAQVNKMSPSSQSFLNK